MPCRCAFIRFRSPPARQSGVGDRFAGRFCPVVGEGSFEVSVRSRKTFQQLVTLPDAAVPLAEAALIVACEEYPQLELSPYLDMLDHIAEVTQERIAPS